MSYKFFAKIILNKKQNCLLLITDNLPKRQMRRAIWERKNY